MKASKYNLFFETENGCMLAYNFLSGSFAKIKKENIKLFKKIMRNPDVKTESDEVTKLKKQLVIGRFLIEDDADEIKIFKVMNRVGRFQANRLKLVIAPTLDCNFRCAYCYENLKKVRMTQDTESYILKFAEKAFKNISYFNVTWYGGEPLLRFDAIARLSEKFVSICLERNIEYTAGMVTNGYLLGDDVIDKLEEYRIKSMQITLDGPMHVHDKRRKLENGGPTFDKIISNIEKAINKTKTKINLRINVDKENYETVLELFDDLERRNLIKKINIGFAPIGAYTEKCADYSYKCFTNKEYGDLEIRIFEEAVSRGLMIKNLPIQKDHYCIADSWGSFAVDPEGDLYKCYTDIGEKLWSVGNIKNHCCPK